MIFKPRPRRTYLGQIEYVKCPYCNKTMHSISIYRHNKQCPYFGIVCEKRPVERLVDSIIITFE